MTKAGRDADTAGKRPKWTGCAAVAQFPISA
jgi:hypothetical protein